MEILKPQSGPREGLSDNQEDIFDAIKKIEEAISSLNDPQEREESEKKLVNTVKNYLKEFGEESQDNITSVLNKVVKEDSKVLVRRVNPKNLFKTINQKENYEINYDSEHQIEDKGYPNAALLSQNLEGLKIPYNQGFSKIGTGALVLIAGFNPEGMKVEKVGKEELTYMNERERNLVRKVAGKTDYENIKFIIARYPRKFFPEDMMTDEELENEKLSYISRVFIPDKKNKTV